MTGLAHRLQTLRTFLVELGPLRPVALTVAVVPTIGMLVVLRCLPELAAVVPTHWLGAGVVAGGTAVATAAVLLPPSICALLAGYCLGAAAGGAAAAFGIGVGGVIGQRLVWPLLGARMYAFMRSRPRVAHVQRLCAGSTRRQTCGVADLRAAALFPFAVISLLLSAASVPARAVWIGTTVSALPLSWLAGSLGTALRRWQEAGVGPTAPGFANLALAALVVVVLAVRGRRRWRRVSAYA